MCIWYALSLEIANPLHRLFVWNLKATVDNGKKPHHFLDFLFLATDREKKLVSFFVVTYTYSLDIHYPHSSLPPYSWGRIHTLTCQHSMTWDSSEDKSQLPFMEHLCQCVDPHSREPPRTKSFVIRESLSCCSQPLLSCTRKCLRRRKARTLTRFHSMHLMTSQSLIPDLFESMGIQRLYSFSTLHQPYCISWHR